MWPHQISNQFVPHVLPECYSTRFIHFWDFAIDWNLIVRIQVADLMQEPIAVNFCRQEWIWTLSHQLSPSITSKSTDQER